MQKTNLAPTKLLVAVNSYYSKILKTWKFQQIPYQQR